VWKGALSQSTTVPCPPAAQRRTPTQFQPCTVLHRRNLQRRCRRRSRRPRPTAPATARPRQSPSPRRLPQASCAIRPRAPRRLGGPRRPHRARPSSLARQRRSWWRVSPSATSRVRSPSPLRPPESSLRHPASANVPGRLRVERPPVPTRLRSCRDVCRGRDHVACRQEAGQHVAVRLPERPG